MPCSPLPPARLALSHAADVARLLPAPRTRVQGRRVRRGFPGWATPARDRGRRRSRRRVQACRGQGQSVAPRPQALRCFLAILAARFWELRALRWRAAEAAARTPWWTGQYDPQQGQEAHGNFPVVASRAAENGFRRAGQGQRIGPSGSTDRRASQSRVIGRAPGGHDRQARGVRHASLYGAGKAAPAPRNSPSHAADSG